MFDTESCSWPEILLQMLTSFWSLLPSDTLLVAPPAHDWESENTLNKTSVEKCKDGFVDIKRSEVSKKVQSLLTLFENNITMFAEFQFRIHYHSKILKMVNRLNDFIVNDGGLRLNTFFPKINEKVFWVGVEWTQKAELTAVSQTYKAIRQPTPR